MPGIPAVGFRLSATTDPVETHPAARHRHARPWLETPQPSQIEDGRRG
jgi:hypothetical protein